MSDGNRAGEAGALSRREFMGVSVAGLVGATMRGPQRGTPPLDSRGATASSPPAFELEEATIADLRAGMESGKYTSRSICEAYLRRIDEIDARGLTLRSVLRVNPDALSIADALDAERKSKGARGPLHGIPVLVKDNLDTADRMPTAAGSLALESSIASRDSLVVERLRAAGAVILGKTNLSEWANFRSTHASSGWSGVGGQTRNPYVLDRSPSGSSSGSGAAIAANLCAVAIGTETDGSITSPSSGMSLVGIKPTVGLVSRAGIIPISHSQDTAGPMTRTVTDAAILLGAITGVDTRDDATRGSKGHALTDYTRFLDVDGLSKARIGIARKHYFGYSTITDRIMTSAIDAMRRAGAVIVDPADIATAGNLDADEFDVLLYEFKHDLNAYLATTKPGVPKTLAELIKFNSEHAAQEMPFFGQEIFERAQAKGPLTDKAYRDALARGHVRSRAQGIDATLKKYRLDAIVAPTQGPVGPLDLVNGDSGSGGSVTSPAAVAGYPHITVPAGYAYGIPVGISFFGTAWSEPTLIKLAYAFEQLTRVRKPPRFLPTPDLTARL